ncbi:MAG: hypothetical protein FVQ81_03355 [Candidatus Glassbacteria bacterium]|nr:hypothetical protein [Candidatus Glassbacteria bacterium]
MHPKNLFTLAVTLLIGWSSVAQGGEISGTVAVRGARNSANVVVFVEQAEGPFSVSEEHAIMDQKGMKFIPHVLPVLLGTTVDYLNSDNVMHNVFTPSKVADKFNLGTWPQGESRSFTFKKQGTAVMLCNVHPEMEAWVVVLQNPYFAVTDKSGAYSIENLPAGTYTLKLWHEKLKNFEPQIVNVPAEGKVVSDLNLKR